MKRVRTSELLPGMTTAEDVYSYNNQMIVPNNTVLTDKMITRLEFYSVLAVRIKDDPVAAKEEASPFDMPSYSERIKSSRTFLNSLLPVSLPIPPASEGAPSEGTTSVMSVPF